MVVTQSQAPLVASVESLLESKHTDSLPLEKPHQLLALTLHAVNVPGGKDTVLFSISLWGIPLGTSVEGDVLTNMPARQMFLAPQDVRDPRDGFGFDEEVVPEAVALPAAPQLLDCGGPPGPNCPDYPVSDGVRGQVSYLPNADPPHSWSGSAAAGTCLVNWWGARRLQRTPVRHHSKRITRSFY